MLERMQKIFQENRREWKEINEFLYHNPELGHQEFQASRLLAESLERHGFSVEKPFCNLETAFVGKYKRGEGGPKIAILVEYDALPGIGHGCGHNSFAVTSLAAGILIKNLLEEREGELWVIGSPAEETSGAKVDMAKAGIFDEMDVAMAAHPTGEAHKRSSVSQAMEALEFTFRGKTAHAAGEPHEGINALDGVLSLFHNINAMRQQTKDDVRIHGIISKGGEAANIIPDLAVANFYVRANLLKDLNPLVERVKNCAKGAALATGTELEIRNYETSFANLVTNQKLSEIYEKNLVLQGVSKILDDKGFGSTDMGDVSHCCPTIHPYYPLCQEKLIGHSVELAKASIGEEAYQGMQEAAIAMALTAKELLENPELLQKIREEFERTEK